MAPKEKYDSRDVESWVPKDLVESAISENIDVYSKFYDKCVEKKSLFVSSLNWGAILIFPGWLAYRKFYSVFFVYLSFIIGSTFLEELYNFELGRAGYLGVNLALAIHARAFLLQNINAKYWALQKKGLTNEEIKLDLDGLHRPSWPLGVAGLVFMLVLAIASSVLIEVYFKGI